MGFLLIMILREMVIRSKYQINPSLDCSLLLQKLTKKFSRLQKPAYAQRRIHRSSSGGLAIARW